MEIKIALAGNPNSGKTTLFNALTGSNQFVGNWPGVTVEKKEGKLKGRDNVIITDLPGIYSLSPYTLEEVVARNYLIDERPDAILNIVDGTNLERNLYLTTQLREIGIPVVIAINMMDILRKRGDKIDISALSKALGCHIVEISALKSDGILEAAELAIKAAEDGKFVPSHIFSGEVEHTLAHIEEAAVHNLPSEVQRWYAIKIFERDEKVIEKLEISPETVAHIESDIKETERILDDDAESIITNERYNYITRILEGIYKRKSHSLFSTSDKIDKVVTNRFLALPIFAVIMFLVYFISVSTVGTWATDFMNDGLFGEGFYVSPKGEREYSAALEEYSEPAFTFVETYVSLYEAQGIDVKGIDEVKAAIEERDIEALGEALAAYGYQMPQVYDEAFGEELPTLDIWFEEFMAGAPEKSDYKGWIKGIPVLAEQGLEKINCAEWLKSLVVDGIIGGVGAVLGFVPQIFVLFIFLAFLEACGYMSRIAFVMDRIFRKLGLSGKSFIPMLIGTGCSVPGIMATRTIENLRDRRMTIITTSFIPCGAKLPVIALISGAIFNDGWWVAPLAYFIGIAAVVVSGLILKKTKMFVGDPAPFVMELPAYHMPTIVNILRSMWERGWSFIKKAGTIILLSTVFIWLGSSFGFVDGKFVFDSELALENSLLGYLGMAVGWIFAPLGFSGIETTVATVMGLLAKEEIVAVLGVLDFAEMGGLAAISFLVFNLLCAPCFAAVGAIRREMNSGKWTLFAIGYQTGLAYAVSLCIYQIGMLVSGNFGWHILGGVASAAVIAACVYLIARPYAKVEAKKSPSLV